MCKLLKAPLMGCRRSCRSSFLHCLHLSPTDVLFVLLIDMMVGNIRQLYPTSGKFNQSCHSWVCCSPLTCWSFIKIGCQLNPFLFSAIYPPKQWHRYGRKSRHPQHQSQRLVICQSMAHHQSSQIHQHHLRFQLKWSGHVSQSYCVQCGDQWEDVAEATKREQTRNITNGYNKKCYINN